MYNRMDGSKQSIPSNYASLHSTRKVPTKPWKRFPIAPLPPTAPKIYKVDPINFKDLVQTLTAAPEFLQNKNRRSHNSAPPPLTVNVSSYPMFNNTNEYRREVAVDIVRPVPKRPPSLSAMYDEFSEELRCDNNSVASSFLGLNFSPSSYSWCSFPLLSPETTSTFLEESRVL